MATKNGELETEVVLVTPELAAKWLETMVINRALSTATVRRYVELMQAGEWKLDASPMRFNTKGELMDGQHRLWAVIESGLEQRFLVVRNVTDDAFLVMDNGKRRNFGDTLSIQFPEMKNISSVAGATRIIYRASKGYSTPSLTSSRGREISNEAMLAFFTENEDSVLAATAFGDRVYNKLRAIPLSHWALLVWQFQTIDLDDANYFFQHLIDGKNQDDGSPILRLREFLMDELNAKARSHPERVAYVIKAWNLYRDGTTIQRLLVKLGGANPEPYPVAH
jgi:hypothetical protein